MLISQKPTQCVWAHNLGAESDAASGSLSHSRGTPQDEMPGGFVFALFLIVYFRDLFYFMCMGVSPASMFMHHVCSAHRGQKKALGPLGT